MRVSFIRRRVASASNRSTMATDAPAESVATRPVVCPRTCENGAAPSTTSLGESASAAEAASAAAQMPPWVRTAPFARPDVPEVKRITAGSPSSRATGVTSAGTTSSSTSHVSTTSRASEMRRRSSTSRWASSGFKGTTMAPIRSAPSHTATKSGPLGRRTATRSPVSTPSSWRRVALRAALLSSAAYVSELPS